MIKFKIILTTILLITIKTNSQKVTKASYYHDKFINRKTASGEVFKQTNYTAASNYYALGTIVKVCRKDNDSICTEVKVNDRINKKYSNRIDLSKSAMKDLQGVREGVIEVNINTL